MLDRMRRAGHDHEPPNDEQHGTTNECVELQPGVEARPSKILIKTCRHASYSCLDKLRMRRLLGVAAVLKLQPGVVCRNGGLHPSYALAPGIEADAPAENGGTDWPQRPRQGQSILSFVRQTQSLHPQPPTKSTRTYLGRPSAAGRAKECLTYRPYFLCGLTLELSGGVAVRLE